MYRAFGCVGAIVDGAVRDVDEMTQAGFKALARRMCVGHCFAHPVRWGCDVEVFGTRVQPGQLIHADKHGFLVVPKGEERGLLEASRFMDSNECDTMIAAAREALQLPVSEALPHVDKACAAFGKNTAARFARKGEW
jgi:regulator of RNase E activity RraA